MERCAPVLDRRGARAARQATRRNSGPARRELVALQLCRDHPGAKARRDLPAGWAGEALNLCFVRRLALPSREAGAVEAPGPDRRAGSDHPEGGRPVNAILGALDIRLALCLSRVEETAATHREEAKLSCKDLPTRLHRHIPPAAEHLEAPSRRSDAGPPPHRPG